jgi:hypothetical protein
MMRARTFTFSTAMAVFVALAATAAWPGPSAAAASASVSGVAYQDANRNGVRDEGEVPFGGHQLYLIAGATVVDTVSTGSDGSYTFSGIGPGDYVVRYASSAWRSIRDQWVPTTTGTVWPEVRVTVTDAATVDFGWRSIVTSSTLGAPISSVTAVDGLRVDSYTDAVAAVDILAALRAGSLVGEEASSVAVRFGYGDVSATTSAVQSSGGVYTRYTATVSVSYRSWLDSRDETLFHEYGHAWAGYFASMVQQDRSLTGYVEARGLTGDPRLNTSYGWSVGEMIAEDYRQLFGTATAAVASQINRDIPPPSEVPGLADYLTGAFRDGPAAEEPPVEEPPVEEPAPEEPTAEPTPTKGGGKGGGGDKGGGGKGRLK